MASSPNLHLIGAYPRYSSWTQRVLAVLKHFKIPHTAEFHDIYDLKFIATIQPTLPAGCVPVICTNIDNVDMKIHDSLAILEFLAERYPDLALWPKDVVLRTLARCIVAEFHAGFSELRNTYHSNFIRRYVGDVPISEKVRKEMKRLREMWEEAREVTKKRLGDADKGYLFGEFGIADAVYWVVLGRIRTYGLPLGEAAPVVRRWIAKMWSDEWLKEVEDEMREQALNHPETEVAAYNNLFPGHQVEMKMVEEGWKFTV